MTTRILLLHMTPSYDEGGARQFVMKEIKLYLFRPFTSRAIALQFQGFFD